MALHVHLVNAYNTARVDDLQGLLREDIVLSWGDEPPVCAQYEIIVGGFVTPTLLQASPALRAVVVPFAGVPPKTRDLVAEYPHLSLHNLHYNVAPTAEAALALLLAAAKFIVPIDRELRAGDWRSRYGETPVTVLQGKTALILGYGQIGQYLAPILRALGMTVIAIRRDPPPPGDDDPAAVFPPGALHELLPRADVLMNVLPLTPETRGIIGATEFARLPAGALVVNVGRGPTIDEAALYHALRDGTLLAAGIDVWYRYPEGEDDRVGTPPSEFPFHELDNVVMSPHRAGYLSAAEEMRMRHLADLLNAAAAGAPIPNRVNIALGY